MYTLLLVLIYIAFVSLGLPDSLLGSGWPAMHSEMDIPVSYMGIISMVISGGTIVSSLLSEKMTRKFSTKIVTVVSVFMTVVALFGFSVSKAFWQLILFSIPFGLGAGAIDAALNNYVALHYSSKSMSWLHCSWGVGTIVSPFVMSYALTEHAWNDGYRIVGVLQLIIALLLLATLPVWRVNSEKVCTEKPSAGLLKALKIKGVPFILIGFFAYCAAEATTMYWASTYFSEVKGMPDEQASQLASLFYIGITAGRFLCGFITDKLGDRKMIIIGTCVMLLGVSLLMIPTDYILISQTGFIIIGFGCAPVYPCIIHSTPVNFGEENSGTIIGIQMASAYAGTTFIPPLFGLIGGAAGYGILPVYLLIFIALMIFMVEYTFRLTGRSSR